MNKVLLTETLIVEGVAGAIEVLRDLPESVLGIAIIAHPHPLFGGTNTNKVAYTLAKTLRDLGYCALRPNFRGVGASEGVHDHGVGETEDLLALIAWAKEQYGDVPIVLAGFSFGAFVQTRVAKRLIDAGHPAKRLILVGTASGFIEGARKYEAEAVTPDSIVIHGSRDQVVPLENVLDWAEPLNVPVIVVPGSDHFFHARLPMLREIIERAWR